MRVLVQSVFVCLWTAFASSTALAQQVVEVPPVEVTAEPLENAGLGEGDTLERSHEHDTEETTDVLTSDVAVSVRSLSSALDMEAGVFTRQAGGDGQRESISIRGASPQSTAVSLEGVPLNSPFLGSADMAGMDLLPVSRLVLSLGGAADKFGAGAVGGLVDVRLPDPLGGSWSYLHLGMGAFGLGRVKTGVIRRTQNAGVLVALGMRSSQGDFSFIDTNGRRRTRTHNAAVAAQGLSRVAWSLDEGRRIDLLVEGFADRREIAGLEQFPSESALQRDSRAVVQVSYRGGNGSSSRRRGSVYLSGYYRYLGFHYRDDTPPLGPAVDTALGSHDAVLRAWGREPLGSWASVLWGGTAGATIGRVVRLGQGSYEPWRALVSALGGLSFGPEGGPASAEASLRVEYVRREGLLMMGHVGASCRLASGLSLFADADKVVRLPTFEELYFQAGFVQGNPTLRPEASWNWDAGVRYRPGRSFQAKVAYFGSRVSDMILFLPVSAFLIKAQNADKTLVQGLEAQVRWRIHWAFLLGAYTYLHGTTTSGRAVPYRPDHVGSARVGVDSDGIRAWIGTRVRSGFVLDRYGHQSERPRVFLDLRVDCFPEDWLVLTLEIQNLLDVRGAIDAFQQPLPGRAAYVGISLLQRKEE